MLEKLNTVAQGILKRVFECEDVKKAHRVRGIYTDLAHFEKPNSTQPRFVSKLNLQNLNTSRKPHGLTMFHVRDTAKRRMSPLMYTAASAIPSAGSLEQLVSWTQRCWDTMVRRKKATHPPPQHLYCPQLGGAMITSFQGHCYCTQLLQLGLTDYMVTCCYYQFTSAAPLTAISVSITMFWS